MASSSACKSADPAAPGVFYCHEQHTALNKLSMLTVSNFAEDLFIVFSGVESRAMQHLIDDNTQSPHVNSIRVALVLCLFRCDVLFGAS